MKIALIVGTIVVALFVAFVGTAKIGVWSDVGRDSLVTQIDQAIGGFTVKRKEAENSVAALKVAVGRIQEGKIKTEVKAEQLEKQHEAIQEKMSGAQSSLMKLKELIAADKPATLAGVEYDVAGLQAMAQKVITAYQSLKTQAEGVDRAHQLLDDSSDTLAARAEQAKVKLTAMESQLEETDAKLLALDAMKGAASEAGASSESLAEQFKEVEGQLNNLYADVETGLRIEQLTWDESKSAAIDVDSIIRDTQTPASTIDQIDAVLAD